MQTLSRSVYKGDVPPPQIAGVDNSQAMAATEMRLNQLEDQLRRLMGMVEENSYRIRQMEDQVKMLGNAGQAQSPVMSSRSSHQGISTTNDKPLTIDDRPYQLGTITNDKAATPAGLYDQAFSYLQTNDYASAKAAFEQFIEQYPDHSLAANSKYWLGETFYAQGDYQAASRAFARSFKDHPDGQKAPDTLLKLAMSLKAQDMTEEACLTLGELGNRFPNAPSSIQTKAATERQSYGCQ